MHSPTDSRSPTGCTPRPTTSPGRCPAATAISFTACYLHTDQETDRNSILRQAYSRLDVDGVLVMTDHASVPPWSWASPDTTFPTPAESLGLLELDDVTPGDRICRTEVCTSRRRRARGPDGLAADVIDTVVVIRSARLTV